MVKVLTVDDIVAILSQQGLQATLEGLVAVLEQDFKQWKNFSKSPRHATHLQQGVIELMPTCSNEYYTFKYVNGHPLNPQQGKLTVVALGMLADVQTGYPVLISEMTLLTALRTAAISVLASRYLAKKNARSLGMIGVGSQAEFQVLAHHLLLGVQQVKYYDIDSNAMEKLEHHLKNWDIELIPCDNAQSAVNQVDIVITATAAKKKACVLENEWIAPGVHINGLGGDCPGKTELDPKLLARSKIVVEYLAQSQIEGEIQNIPEHPIYAELWELVAQHKPARETEAEITLFDSVGFALEDYSALRYMMTVSTELNLGHSLNLIPELANPKDLYSLIAT